MLREARIILPMRDNAGEPLYRVKDALARELGAAFGGYTLLTSGHGSWNNAKGGEVSEYIWIFDVAAADNTFNDELLTQIAASLKISARQDAIYLRLPSGEVHFV